MRTKATTCEDAPGIIYPSRRTNHAPSSLEISAIAWNGQVAAVYIRNSTRVQRGNDRARWQMDLASYLLGSGYAVKIYDEQGVSGATLTGRSVATQMLIDLRLGIVTCITVAELSRLTRDHRGFDAQYLVDVLINFAQGKVITYDKVFDLRRAEDRREFDRLAVASAQHGTEMSRTLAAGLVTGFQSRPVFRGPCRLGYRRVQVINSTGSIEVDRYGKVRTVLQKDPSVLGVMQELARQFDAQPNLRAICRAMHSAEWAAPWKPITGGYVWRSARLKSLLSDSIYEGIWRFEPSSRPATLWAEVSRYSGIEHKIPELAWYSSSQMSRWRDKFLGGAAAFARGVHDHPLFGVIACANCHELLSKNGKNGYRCANYGRRCGPGLFVKDKLALQAIDEAIPLLIARIENPAHVIGTADIGNRMAAVELEYAELENRLSFGELSAQFSGKNANLDRRGEAGTDCAQDTTF